MITTILIYTVLVIVTYLLCCGIWWNIKRFCPTQRMKEDEILKAECLLGFCSERGLKIRRKRVNDFIDNWLKRDEKLRKRNGKNNA